PPDPHRPTPAADLSPLGHEPRHVLTDSARGAAEPGCGSGATGHRVQATGRTRRDPFPALKTGLSRGVARSARLTPRRPDAPLRSRAQSATGSPAGAAMANLTAVKIDAPAQVERLGQADEERSPDTRAARQAGGLGCCQKGPGGAGPSRGTLPWGGRDYL